MTDRCDAYAEAFFSVLAAEGSMNEAQDELFRFSRILEGNDELYAKLADQNIPAARRQQIVEDLLGGGRAFPATIGLVSLVVVTGRLRELPTIVDRLLQRTASLTNRTVAEVRSAVELTDEQRKRLTESLKKATGLDVDLVVIIDPTVIGGIVTQIGDTVIDGSIRHRLAQLKESF
jgi:F-type H+-transporting ATPase subunit delta